MPQEIAAPVVPTKDPLRRRPLLRMLRNWRQRHRHPFNFAIHLVGIPLAVSGVVLLYYEQWLWGVANLVVGYALQFWGHRVEGNDVGEWAAIKRILGLPVVTVAPTPPQTRASKDAERRALQSP